MPNFDQRVQIQTNDSETTLLIDYAPAKVTKQFIEDPTFCTGYFGPLGCGKTTAGVIKTFLYAQAFPGARIAIIRDTYPNLIDTSQKTFFEWLPEGPAGHYVRSTRTFYLRTPNPDKPAEIIFRAADQKDDITNLLSLDLAAAFVDEPQGGLNLASSDLSKEPGLDEELVKILQSRIGRQSGYRPMWWMTGNPPSPHHWIARMFDYTGVGQPKNFNPEAHLYLGNSESNTHNLTPGYYDRLERLFGKDTPLARRFILGEWVELAQLNPFKASWMQYYTEQDLPKKGLIIDMGLDPAISKNDAAAMTAIVVAGQSQLDMNTKGLIYFLDYASGHWSLYEQVEKVLQMARKWKARTIRVEEGPLDKAVAEVLYRELRMSGLRLAIEPVSGDTDKIRKANSWSHLVEDGTIRFKEDQIHLMSCLLSVPQDRKSWDIVDAAGICVKGFPRIYPASSILPGHELSTPALANSYGAPQLMNNKITPQKIKTYERVLNGKAKSNLGYFQNIGVRR